MKLASVRIEGAETVVIALPGEKEVVRLHEALVKSGATITDYPTLKSFLAAGEEARANLDKATEVFGECTSYSVDDLEWLPPIPEPTKIVGVAMNNRKLNSTAHVDPVGPMFFLKPSTSLVGNGGAIEIADDYGFTFPELELGVVIGKEAKNVTEEEALDHVAGYTIVNDVTSQGLKRGDSIAVDVTLEKRRAPGYDEYFNWRRHGGDEDRAIYFTYHARSKGTDTFGPMGPWLTTADEIENPDTLNVRGYADGVPFAEDSTASYSYSVPYIISWASRYFTLKPGDIISTGTAAKGTTEYPRAHHEIDMSRMTPVIDIEIDGLGKLTNSVVHI